MCMGKKKTPPVVQRDPRAEAEAAANEASKKANAMVAEIRRRKRFGSLLTAGKRGVMSRFQQQLVAAIPKRTPSS